MVNPLYPEPAVMTTYLTMWAPMDVSQCHRAAKTYGTNWKDSNILHTWLPDYTACRSYGRSRGYAIPSPLVGVLEMPRA